MARRSFTLVRVGPVTSRSPRPANTAVGVARRQGGEGVEAGRSRALQCVRGHEGAGVVARAVDAVGVGGEGVDARPALEAERQAQQVLGVPARRGRGPSTVTVVSPPDSSTAGGSPWSLHSCSSMACSAWRSPTSRASPSMLSPSTTARRPRVARGRRGRGTASRAVASTTALARARRGSPGLGVSCGRAGAARGPGAQVAPRRARAAPRRDARRVSSAWANVVGSATVGPEAITDGSSPGTSETSSATTGAGQAASARRPPFMDDRCLRTQLTAAMGAPLRSSAAETSRSSASSRPGRGQGEQRRAAARDQAEHEVVLGQARDRGDDASRRVTTCLVGHWVGGLDDGHLLAVDGVPVGRDDDARQGPLPAPLDRARHGRGRLAGAHDHGASGGRRRQPGRHDRLGRCRGHRGVEQVSQQRTWIERRGAGRGGLLSRRWSPPRGEGEALAGHQRLAPALARQRAGHDHAPAVRGVVGLTGGLAQRGAPPRSTTCVPPIMPYGGARPVRSSLP